jgi:hypothetical protein
MPRVQLGHPVTGGTYIQGADPPGLGLDARPTTLLCKRSIVAKSKEMKTGCNLADFSKQSYGSRNAVLPVMMMMMMMMNRSCTL